MRGHHDSATINEAKMTQGVTVEQDTTAHGLGSEDNRIGVPMPPAQRGDQAALLYDAGFSLAQIADRLGVTRQSIWKMLQRRGIKMRAQRRSGSANHFHRGTKAVDHAQNVAEKAIARGDLVPAESCEACGVQPPRYRDGRRGIQAHHDDYTKPLTVRWLCKKCHHLWHQNHTAVGAHGE